MKTSVCILIAGFLLVTGCSDSGSRSSEEQKPAPAAAAEPVPAGKVEVNVYGGSFGTRLYSDEYENTKSDQIFRCFYDKRKVRSRFIVVGYNPSSHTADFKRFYTVMSGDIILNEGKNVFTSSANNSQVSINAKEPSKGEQLYDDLQDWTIAADGCEAQIFKDKNSIEGRLSCSAIRFSSGYGSDLSLAFSCEVTVLK